MFSTTALWCFYTVVALLELPSLRIGSKPKFAKGLAVSLVLLIAFSVGFLSPAIPTALWLCVLAIGIYRIVNVARLAIGRMHQDYLRTATIMTSAVCNLIGGVVIGAYYVLVHTSSSQVLVCLGILVSCIGTVSVARSIKKSRIGDIKLLGTRELPSLTVAIPARNESQELVDCINSFAKSNYEKLEILVFDDQSQDRISDIVKDFAHLGVRFIQGSAPGDTWLPKNAAYEKLAKEASGDILLFCGVDARVESNTLHRLVSYMWVNNKHMVSVLPVREVNNNEISTTQLVRYLWELALPRYITKRPPVLSTLWVIDKKTYVKLGGFASVKRMVIPEAYFSRSLQNAYSFIRANSEIAVSSTKSALEQQLTAVRVRYPQLHKRPQVVLLTSVVELLILQAPLNASFNLYKDPNLVTILLTIISVAIPTLAMIMIVWAVHARGRMRAIAQSFIAIPLDIWLTNYSMYKYEFSSVIWKDRNVSTPVMHVIPSLPKLD